MAIILRLDRVMADRKVSLNQLSELVGVTNVNLSKLKTGKVSAIRFTTLNAICAALECQPATSWSTSLTMRRGGPNKKMCEKGAGLCQLLSGWMM